MLVLAAGNEPAGALPLVDKVGKDRFRAGAGNRDALDATRFPGSASYENHGRQAGAPLSRSSVTAST